MHNAIGIQWSLLTQAHNFFKKSFLFDLLFSAFETICLPPYLTPPFQLSGYLRTSPCGLLLSLTRVSHYHLFLLLGALYQPASVESDTTLSPISPTLVIFIHSFCTWFVYLTLMTTWNPVGFLLLFVVVVGSGGLVFVCLSVCLFLRDRIFLYISGSPRTSSVN